MIQAEELYHTLHRKPFQPFRVHMKNGQSYDILYEHLAVVGVTYFHIAIPEPHQPDDPWPYADYLVEVDLDEIVRVEPIPSATPAKAE